MAFIEALSLDNFKEWVKEILNDIKRKRYIVIATKDNQFFVISSVTTQGLIKPFITGLTEKEVEDMKSWFKERGVDVRNCKHLYIDDRQDPREIRKEN